MQAVTFQHHLIDGRSIKKPKKHYR